MPMHPDTNKAWLAKEPSMALEELEIKSEDQLELLRLYFIDRKAQNLLQSGGNNIGKFLNQRHELISEEIKKLMRV